MRKGRKKLSINILPLLLFILSILLWRTDYYRVSLYLIIPALIGICFITNRKEIISSKYWWIYLSIVIWAFLSSCFSEYRAESFRRMIPVVASFLLSVSVYGIAQKGENARVLYLSYVLFFLFLMAMSFSDTGFIQDFDYADEREREMSSKMDANEYAYYVFFMLMSIRLLFERRNKQYGSARLFFILAFYAILFFVTMYVALFTASRQVLYLCLPLLVAFAFVDFFRRSKPAQFVLILVAGVLLVMIVAPYVLNVYDGSFLAERSRVGFSDDTRSRLMEKAMLLSLEHPLFGVGLGAHVSFSHCTYTHLASRCGLPTMILYAYLVLRFIILQWRRFRITRDDAFLVYCICGLFFFVGCFLYNYIDGPFMMAILFIMIGDSEHCYKEVRLKALK